MEDHMAIEMTRSPLWTPAVFGEGGDIRLLPLGHIGRVADDFIYCWRLQRHIYRLVVMVLLLPPLGMCCFIVHVVTLQGMGMFIYYADLY